MRSSTVLAIVLARLFLTASASPLKCPIVSSCSTNSEHRRIDPCCTPSPGGLFIFRQRLQLDEADEMGNWGIDGLDLLDCDTQKPQAANASSPSYSQEEIASFCLKSQLFQGEKGFAKAEQEWAQSEAGEGVEELWERAWSTSGRYISTLSPRCMESEQRAGVPLFFRVLHDLQTSHAISKLLADADIIPSSDTTYSLSEIQDAIGFNESHPIVSCKDGSITTISWPLIVKGKFQSGEFLPYADLTSSMKESNCPAESIKYPSSVHAPAPKPSEKWDPIFRPQPRAITKPHDESRVYNPPSPEKSDAGAKNPLQLRFFKGKDEKRESKDDSLAVQFSRDEL